MAGFGHDTSSLVLTVALPDERELVIVGESDGVNPGYTWSARVGEDDCAVRAEHEVLIDGITPANECTACGHAPYGGGGCPNCGADS